MLNKENLYRFREGSTEHESLPDARATHLVICYNRSDVLLEAHVQHSICFVQNQMSNLSKCVKYNDLIDNFIYRIL